jgi:hypothetical protein
MQAAKAGSNVFAADFNAETILLVKYLPSQR